MQYLRARYYLPAQGIFNRLDPFFGNQDDPQSLHKYAYVHGDPVNGIDPSGLFTLTHLMARSAIGATLRTIGGNILRTYTTRAIFSPSGFGVVGGTLLAITVFSRMAFISSALKPELMRLKRICGTIPGPSGRLTATLVGAFIDTLDEALLAQGLWTAASPLVSLIPAFSLTILAIRGFNFASKLSDMASLLDTITWYLSASASASGASYYAGAHIQLSTQPQSVLEILRDNMIPYRANPALLVREFSGMLQSTINYHTGSNQVASQALFDQHAAVFDHELASYWIDVQYSYRRYTLP